VWGEISEEIVEQLKGRKGVGSEDPSRKARRCCICWRFEAKAGSTSRSGTGLCQGYFRAICPSEL